MVIMSGYATPAGVEQLLINMVYKHLTSLRSSKEKQKAHSHYAHSGNQSIN